MTAEKRAAVTYLTSAHEMSERRSCKTVRLSRSAYRYRRKANADGELQAALGELAARYPEMGFGKYYRMLRRAGRGWNHKRVHRVYCALKLNRRRKHKRRLPARHPKPLTVPLAANQCWSADFMSDALWDGRRFRTFNVVDDYSREALGVEIDTNLPAPRVVRVLDRLAEVRGVPAQLRLDNGPELTAVAIAEWAERHQVKLEFIEPGRPMQNGFIERFNRTYREAVLDMYLFETLAEVRQKTGEWLEIYNHERPHDSLGGMPPSEFLRTQNPENSILGWT